MSTLTTETMTVTIDAPYDRVAEDLADPTAHPEWGTNFFSGPARQGDGNAVVVAVPMMGGDVRFSIAAWHCLPKESLPHSGEPVALARAWQLGEDHLEMIGWQIADERICGIG